MCLIIDSIKEPTVNNEDVTCYKVLEIKGDNLIAPYRGMDIEIGGTYESKLVVEHDEYDRYVNIGLHSFCNIDDARIEIRSWKNFYFGVEERHSYVIVRCYIPRGSCFYGGIFQNDLGKLSSYASDKLTYVEILKEKICV